MSSQGRAASTTVDRCGLGGGRRTGVAAGRMVLAVLLAAALLLCAASAAGAASFYWYGENGSTCRQTGQPPSSSSSCEPAVGEHYLNSSNPPRVIGGALATNIELTTGSGDYCNAYNIGDALINTDEIDEGPWTGVSMPKPFGGFQESDTHKTVCQASGSTWGQEVRGAANAECTGAGHEPCGMQHYVSFYSQGLNDKPWSSAFGSPSLFVSAEADPQTTTNHGGAWGYICPLLRQGTTNHILEYCIEEWRTGTGYNSFDISAECSGSTNYVWDESITQFAPGTQFATEASGSANTFVFNGNPGGRNFSAYITEANLINAINADNARCHRGLSTTPSEYALVGVEQGMEGRALSELGGHTGNLQLRTEYTHYQIAPAAATQEATGVTPTEATVHGSVNPEGSATEAYFEYGTTTSYGSRVPSPTGWPIGEGTTFIPAYTTLTGLQAGTTYHYRVVGKNAYGASPGEDKSFTTPGPVEAVTSPATGLLETQATLNGTVNPRGYDAKYYFQYGTSTSYTSSTLEGDAGAGSSPVPETAAITGLQPGVTYHFRLVATSGGVTSEGHDQIVTPPEPQMSSRWAVRDAGNGFQYVYYQGANASIDDWGWNSKEWFWYEHAGHAAAAGTSPTVLRNPANGEERNEEQFVYYQGTNGNIDDWGWNGKEWFWYEHAGHPAAAGTSPTAVRNPVNGFQYVYYQGANGNIDYWGWNGKEWFWHELAGHAAAAGTSPTVLRNPANGEERNEEQFVYYQGTNGNIDYWGWNGKEWFWYERAGHPAAVGTSPTAIRDSANGEPQKEEQFVYYQGTNGNIDDWGWNGKEWFWYEHPGHPA
jgi:hypothetical protein